MEKQLSFELKILSSGKKKNSSLKKHLSRKKEQKLKQKNLDKWLINKLLPKKEKELNLKSLSLDKLVQKDFLSELKTLGKSNPKKQVSKKELLFEKRIHKLLSTKEASGLLGVSENALRILVCRKKVNAYKLGSRLKFKLDDLAGCLQQKEV